MCPCLLKAEFLSKRTKPPANYCSSSYSDKHQIFMIRCLDNFIVCICSGLRGQTEVRTVHEVLNTICMHTNYIP